MIMLWLGVQDSRAQCPGNILQNSQFSNGLNQWTTFSGYVPPPVPITLGCLNTFAVLRAYYDTTQAQPAYGDGLSQAVVIDSGKCYNLCLCMAMPVGILFGDHIQFWAATQNPGVTYQTLVNNTYPAGSAVMIGSLQVSSNVPQQYCINNWYAPASFTRLIIINTTQNNVATVLIDNICMEENLNCSPCINTNITANFSASGNGTLTQFTDLSTTNPGTIIGWEWKFNDPGNPLNDTSTQQNPLYNFSAGGVYIVCLKVFASVPTPDGTGQAICVDSTCFCVIVSGGPPMNPCDTAGMSNGFTYTSTNLTVSFSGTSNTAFSWVWDFGDPSSGPNNTSTLQNPVHTFTAPGNYLVCLIISYPGSAGIICRDTLCKDVQLLTTGMPDAMNEGIEYYPNPVTDYLNLRSSRDSECTIKDAMGRKILQTRLEGTFNRIDLSALSPGVYFLEVLDHDGRQEVVKIIRR